MKKRKLGRNPRVPFTQHQVATLEQKFQRTHYLSSVDVAELSAALNLTETRVSFTLHMGVLYKDLKQFKYLSDVNPRFDSQICNLIELL